VTTTGIPARARVSITSDPETGTLRITIGDGGPSLVRRERLDDRVTAFIGIDDTVTGFEILGAVLHDGWDAHVDSAIELAMARHPAGSRAA
jgi:uncharacterized protein YuzE